MFSPGFDEEMKTKPQITKDIEEGDQPATTEYAAMALYKGVVKGHAHISSNFITDLFKASTRGAVPRNNWIMDGFLDFIAFVRSFDNFQDVQLIVHRLRHPFGEHQSTDGCLLTEKNTKSTLQIEVSSIFDTRQISALLP